MPPVEPDKTVNAPAPNDSAEHGCHTLTRFPSSFIHERERESCPKGHQGGPHSMPSWQSLSRRAVLGIPRRATKGPSTPPGSVGGGDSDPGSPAGRLPPAGRGAGLDHQGEFNRRRSCETGSCDPQAWVRGWKSLSPWCGRRRAHSRIVPVPGGARMDPQPNRIVHAESRAC
jgi:hypothetical protein